MSVVAELYRRARQKAVAYEMEGLLRDRLETPVHWTKQGVLLNAGLVVSLLILAAAGWQSARSLRAVAASDQWVTHSQNVILELDGLISALKDEETGRAWPGAEQLGQPEATCPEQRRAAATPGRHRSPYSGEGS